MEKRSFFEILLTFALICVISSSGNSSLRMGETSNFPDYKQIFFVLYVKNPFSTPKKFLNLFPQKKQVAQKMILFEISKGNSVGESKLTASSVPFSRIPQCGPTFGLSELVLPKSMNSLFYVYIFSKLFFFS